MWETLKSNIYVGYFPHELQENMVLLKIKRSRAFQIYIDLIYKKASLLTDKGLRGRSQYMIQFMILKLIF